ncbi:MAG: hypothetical protein KTR29_25055 [Rhodothermaceae bacterium]|nr:hypothetical protein [Rhodothermaceae bacterium]
MRIPVIVLFLLLFLSSCDSNDEPEEQVIENMVFVPGQQRMYEQTLITLDLDDEGNEVGRTVEVDTFIVEAQSESEPVPEFEETIQVSMHDTRDPDRVNSYWYTQNDSQLVEIAYRDVGFYVMLKNGWPQMGNPLLPTIEFQEEIGSPDEIRVRDIPRVVMEFPLVEGRNWISLVDPGLNLVITGEVLEPQEIEIPAGKFLSQVIKTTHAFRGTSIEIFHYVSAEGLVKRIESNEFENRDAQNNPSGIRAYERTLVLIDVQN